MTTPDTKSSHRRDSEDFPARGTHANTPRTSSNQEDDVENTLHLAQELIRQAVSRRRRDSQQIRVLSDDETAFHTVIDEMINKAQREVLCVLAPRDLSAERRSQVIRLLQAAHHRGVNVKALVPPLVATNNTAVRSMGDQPGCRVRDLPDQHLVITDARQAALRTPHREDECPQTLLISVRPLVLVLRTMITASWSSSVVLPEHLNVQEKLREEPARSVLASLSAGEKDEVAARKLGISVRTYRRHVAGIMRDIDANSRFQAGARAARLGIIS
jgi:hypothetical protein